MSHCTALHTETRVFWVTLCLFKGAICKNSHSKQTGRFYCWEFKVSTCSNSSCSMCSSARRNWWQHPDEDHGVEERGGHVGHQSQLQEEVWSVSLQHHPGTDQCASCVCMTCSSSLILQETWFSSPSPCWCSQHTRLFLCLHQSTSWVFCGCAAHTPFMSDGVQISDWLVQPDETAPLLFTSRGEWMYSPGPDVQQSYCLPPVKPHTADSE